MYSALSSKLSVTDAGNQFSPALSMEGSNAAQLEATVFVNTATSLTIELQGSNDMQNWSVITTNAGLVVGFSAPAKSTGIGYAWIRLRYAVVGVGTVIVAAGLNLSLQ